MNIIRYYLLPNSTGLKICSHKKNTTVQKYVPLISSYFNGDDQSVTKLHHH